MNKYINLTSRKRYILQNYVVNIPRQNKVQNLGLPNITFSRPNDVNTSGAARLIMCKTFISVKLKRMGQQIIKD